MMTMRGLWSMLLLLATATQAQDDFAILRR